MSAPCPCGMPPPHDDREAYLDEIMAAPETPPAPAGEPGAGGHDAASGIPDREVSPDPRVPPVAAAAPPASPLSPGGAAALLRAAFEEMHREADETERKAAAEWPAVSASRKRQVATLRATADLLGLAAFTTEVVGGPPVRVDGLLGRCSAIARAYLGPERAARIEAEAP
jgi:hypothetical protein